MSLLTISTKASKKSLGTPVYACRRGVGGWDLVDNCNTAGESIAWLREVMASMVLHGQGMTISPADDGSGTPIDRDPFARIPQLEPVSRPRPVPRGTVDIREGTFNDRSRVGRAWFAHGFIPAFFKVLSLGSIEDRAMLANVMKTPAQQRKQCVYTLLSMAVSSELGDLDGIAPDVGDASQQLPPSTDYGVDPSMPMDIDIASPSEVTYSDSAVVDESTIHQRSAPPDLTQRRERQASEDNDGEERTHYSGGGGHEVTATHPVGYCPAAGGVHGREASLTAHGYAPDKSPRPPTKYASTTDLYNGLAAESELDMMRKEIPSLRIQLEKQDECLKDHKTQHPRTPNMLV